MSVYFGLHVGRTSACLAVHRDGRLDVVANDAGDRTTPACVGINEGEVLVGSSAKQLHGRKPTAVVRHNKKILTLNESDLKLAIENSGPPHCPKLVSSSGNPEYVIEAGEGVPAKRLSATSVQTHIFKYMHDIAASHATTQVNEKNTVLTVPYTITKKQRDVISKCAELAGFHIVQVISEPASACMAYSIGQLDQSETFKCIIYRCGGSSLTASVAVVNSGMISIVESVTKDEGGDNITNILSDYLADEFKRKYKVDPRESKRGKTKLHNNAENVKHILSTLDTAKCYIESLYDGIDFSTNVTRARFENELSKVLPSLLDPIQSVLTSSGIKASDIDKIILCGGTCKIPRIHKEVGKLFLNAKLHTNLCPDEVMAMGAACQSSLLSEPWQETSKIQREDEKVRVQINATALDIGYVLTSGATSNGITNVSILIPKGTPVPIRRSIHLTENITRMNEKISVAVVSLYTMKSEHESEENCPKNIELLSLVLKDITNESKVSLSCHIHRDGSTHFALTDKTSGKCDQITLQNKQSS